MTDHWATAWQIAVGLGLLWSGVLGVVLAIGLLDALIAALWRRWRRYQVRRLLRDVQRRAVLERRIGRRD
jgi:hypothetical protein